MDTEQQSESKADLIDFELSKLVDCLIDEDESDDEHAFDEAEAVLLDIIEQLVDSEEITDIPDEGTPEEEQKKWIAVSIPIIQTTLDAILLDDTEEEPEEEEEEGSEEEE